MLQDSKQRLLATDPCQSFIVQAPAGSGKTEILSQRFLRLLARVNEPEEIVALTFTRKAANEMRERILLALQQVAKQISANSAHQEQTYAYAREALLRDKLRGWQLLQQPGRLRITTIDSLCQRLNHAMPLLEKHVPFARISDNPSAHYASAAQACLTHALENTDYQGSLTIILQHLDNRQDNLLALFSQLLAQRDQWLPTLYSAKSQERHDYEAGLVWIEQHELLRFRQTLSVSQANELIELTRDLVCLSKLEDDNKPGLHAWYSLEELTRPLAAELGSLLLTSQNKLRKAFDHHVGLKRGVCSEPEFKRLKNRSKELFTELNESADFIESLRRIKQLPEPQYDNQQWQVLQALFQLLPLLAAQLHLVFQQHNEVDFSAVSQQALIALGDEERPSDLALQLDYQIHHLLVDEFQDTSIQQFQLLTQLVQGWQVDDGKTLFIVGDPMQSIYRFRAAEVGLFLRAKHHGLGAVQLTPLQLCCNFRSNATLVNWVNHQFQTMFPGMDDIESGAVSFHPSTPVKPASNERAIQANTYPDSASEASAIVNLLADELITYPNDSFAILVRSRSQLSQVISQLKRQQIPFQGIDIDLLSSLPHLRDVWSLTQALLLPANRLAWLCFLRSPYVGLSLSDIRILASVDKKQSIYYALSHWETLTTLSLDGRIRAEFVYKTLHQAFLTRHQQGLADWIINTLNQLNLPQVLTYQEQTDLEQYWLLLETFDTDGLISDWSLFKTEFNKLYSQQVSPSRLQIMTIHKSKGLEFDCVILPGLSSKPSDIDRPLLRWLKLPTEQNDELLLVSPVKAVNQSFDALYDYLGQLDKEKNHYERQRQLYVAVTRAKKRLYLFDNKLKATEKSFRYLLDNEVFVSHESTDDETSSVSQLPVLKRLPIEYYQANLITQESNRSRGSINLQSNQQRVMGIVIHSLLQWICTHHPNTMNDIPWELAHYQLKEFGLTGELFNASKSIIYQQITQLWSDTTGCWIIKEHDSEKNEYELIVSEEHTVSTRIIDRTFVSDNVRWVIDFKTGDHTPDIEEKHRLQVDYYACLLAYSEQRPIHCGVYYLQTNQWINWIYAKKC